MKTFLGALVDVGMIASRNAWLFDVFRYWLTLKSVIFTFQTNFSFFFFRLKKFSILFFSIIYDESVVYPILYRGHFYLWLFHPRYIMQAYGQFG